MAIIAEKLAKKCTNASFYIGETFGAKVVQEDYEKEELGCQVRDVLIILANKLDGDETAPYERSIIARHADDPNFIIGAVVGAINYLHKLEEPQNV